jgi:hypothetical protein
MTNYDQLQYAIESSIFRCSDDDYAKRWGLMDLYKLSLRGSSAQIEYIMAHAEQLIKYCERKARNYAGLQKDINARV